jgi:acyl-homoserine lactone acylase PvdQ
LQNYSAGVNEFIADLKLRPPDQHPVEYAGTGNPIPAFPENWTPEDTAFLVVLQLRVFGETAGGELDHAALYQHLTKRLGPRDGRAVFNDILFQNDPRSYTSIPRSEGRFNSQFLGRVNWDSVAIPDNAKQVAKAANQGQELRARLLAEMGFKAPASNAILVAASESETGNPLEIGAPQVGYATPAFFMDVEVHYPGVDFRGPAVPGASALIPLGRGADYAWSLTTGFSDAVDTRVERLCEPDGGPATTDSNGYRFGGDCRAMSSRTETFTVKPPPTDPGPPSQEERTFYRTRHGPVFKRATVNGKPVALVKQRFFWKKEIDSVPRFYQWNAQVDDVDDFRRAASQFTMSFNSFYADSEDIGYFHVGHYPLRRKGMHPSLPTWGGGRWEWTGRLPFYRHPKVVNPDQGWIVNWNNKPATGWDNFDGHKFGRVHRVRLLADNMRTVTRGDRKASLAEITNVIRRAATRDVRAVYLLDSMLRYVRTAEGPNAGNGRRLLRSWLNAGAHRKNVDDDELMERGPALALFDEWWSRMVHSIYDDELGAEAFDFMGGRSAISDYSPEGGSSFFFDFSSHVANLFDPRTRDDLRLNYCDKQGTRKRRESCKTIAIRTFRRAIEELMESQGDDPSGWEQGREDIVMSSQGAAVNFEIPWQNRGTHNHIVEILSDAG